MKTSHIEDSRSISTAPRQWMRVQRAWEENPEQRPQVAANLRRIVRAVNGVVSQPRLSR
jgi:hypothetical protein